MTNRLHRELRNAFILLAVILAMGVGVVVLYSMTHGGG